MTEILFCMMVQEIHIIWLKIKIALYGYVFVITFM